MNITQLAEMRQTVQQYTQLNEGNASIQIQVLDVMLENVIDTTCSWVRQTATVYSIRVIYCLLSQLCLASSRDRQ